MQASISSALVSGFMATCVSVPYDRERMWVEYPSEPPLAEAAARIMSDSNRYKSMLTLLRDSIRHNIVMSALFYDLAIFFKILINIF